MDGFIFRRPGPVDLSGIRKLFVDAQFLSSGPPNDFTDDDLHRWLNDSFSLPVVVYPAAEEGRVVGHISMCRKITASRASRAELEDVCLHPDFLRQGLGSALLMRGFWWAEHRWGATRIEWISEHTPKRADARERYLKLGAELVAGTDSCFRLKLPYTPPDHLRQHFVSVYA